MEPDFIDDHGSLMTTTRISKTVIAFTATAAMGIGIAIWALQPPKPGASTRQARKIVAALRGLPMSPLRVETTATHSTLAAPAPNVPLATEHAALQVVLPARSTEPLRVEDANTGLGVDIQIRDVFNVVAQSAEGYVVYPHAHSSGGTLLHRELDDGAEDYVSFETRPAKPEVAYDIRLKGVYAVRLVENTFELLDESGVPRLRAAPPFIVGADGERVDATVAVDNCAVDTEPAPPWGRDLPAPNSDFCTLRVRWDDAQLKYPAVLDPRWVSTSNMTSVRQDFTATMMSTGKVLAVGGRSSSTSTTGLATAEVFDPATKTWATTSSISGGRYLHMAVQLGTTSSTTTSGKVLVGGGTNAGASLNTAQLYTPSTGVWTAATSLNVARHGATATMLSNGNVLLAGGLSGTAVQNTAAVYNPSSGAGTFTATGTMPQAVKFHSATLLKVSGNSTLNNRLIVVGGTSGAASVTNVQLFDGTSTWSSLTALASAREGHTATALANGNVLIAGGRSGTSTLNTTLLFNAASGSGSWSSAGTLTAARQLHTATLLPSAIVENGQVLVAGGSSGAAALSSAEVWNGTTTWTATSALPSAMQGQTATLLNNNLVLLAGGSNGSTTVATSVTFDGSFALQCTSNSQCATGFCVSGVCCDTACNGGCGVCNLAGKVGTCSAATSGTVCRAVSGACDVAETCSGSSLNCPADAVQPLGFVCRGSAGICDAPEACDGTTKACPTDKFAPATTLCRASTGTCDAAESCTGTSAACPADAFAPATTVCRPAAGGCDAPETCTGTSAICPLDALMPAGSVCRPAVSLCDAQETCSGSSNACPVDSFAAAGTICGGASGGSPAPVCSGSNDSCPVSGGTADVLGFEAAADWSVDVSSGSASIVGTNSNHSQGANALEVAAQNFSRFNSAPVGSIGTVGSVFLIDVMLPSPQPNPNAYGTLQMYLNSPTLGLTEAFLASAPLTGLPLGVWTTVAIPIPPAVKANLASHTYADLKISVVLNVPFNVTGHYLLDNLHSAPDVVPSLIGVAQDGPTLKAVFDYLTTSSTPVTIPYGEANGLSNQNGFITAPTEAPPTTFVSTTHAPFVATLSGSSLTWTINGHSVTATAGSQRLSVTANGDGTNDATLPDGRRVNLDSVPPPNPTNVAGPPVAGPFNGVLSGQFAVTPSGAATYTVPISIPPGIAGMAPNLALIYNSQAGDGIAGQGWSLSGLSMITRCPRTRQQDGYGRPVMLDSLSPANHPDGQTDGICLDGEKLFEQPSGSGKYFPEKQDFSTITRDTSSEIGEFTVVTKGGETRHYGRLNASLVAASSGVAVWLLDRVVDAWGNYFDIQYNNGQGNGPPDELNSFLASGIWVSKINYTGSLSASGCNVAVPPSSCTFNSVTFQYKSRDDVAGESWHSTRYGSLQIPANQLLQSITTPLGTYSLTYQNGIQLTSIGYSAQGVPVQPLTFAWQPNQPHPSASGFALPSFVASGRGLSGTQFVDINGDGLADFVLARTNGQNGPGNPQVATVLNTGTGWSAPLSGTGQTFPLYLADGSDKPTGVRFADLDGDGLIDVMVDHANVVCTGTGNQKSCVSCPVGAAPGSPNCMNPTAYGPAVWLNRFTRDGQGGWSFDSSFSGPSISFTGSNPAMVGDADGDGRADIFEVSQNPGTGVIHLGVTVLLNRTTSGGAHSWSSQPFLFEVPWDGNLQSLSTTYNVEDLNRDGLSDLVHRDYVGYSDGSVASSETAFMNQGLDASGNARFANPIFRSPPSGGTLIDVTQNPPRLADIDGDGFHDLVDYEPSGTKPGFFAALGFGEGTGQGFQNDPGQGIYFQVLKSFSPPFGSTNPTAVGGVPADYGYALIDINGDGLVDLVRNHWQRPPGALPGQLGGGEILLNTGRRWTSTAGNTGWQTSLDAAGQIRFSIPSEVTGDSGSAFLDLDGDGLPDLIQEEQGSSWLPPGAWINQRQRPIISGFPDGLAGPTNVSYVSTTAAAGAATYKDDDTTEANTKPFAVPLSVVSSVSAEDASGTGARNTASYTYHSLRQDSFGRGPLGFHRVEVLDQASQVRTVTTYLQAYPYTGMPAEVDKYQVVGSQSHLTNQTTTTYCDTLASPAPAGLGCGPVQPGSIPPGTTTFVFPKTVVDIAYLHPESDDVTNRIATASTFAYDQNGNSTITTAAITKTDAGKSESFTKSVQNSYATAEEAAEGKPSSTVVTGVGGTASTTHTTTFEYSPVSTFGGSGSRLARSKKHVEPAAGWPTQLDTAYSYDQFGNVVTTTSCASDFSACAAGAVNPFGPGDPLHHPPFRTTTVSYDPSVLGGTVSYGIGRFPTKTVNAAGHTETTIYDPLLGKVLKKTGPNGIQTCYAYDFLGRQTTETDRCGSPTPIVTTTNYFLTLPRPSACLIPPCTPVQTGFSPPNSVVVTVTTPPNGATTWSYGDDQGKSTGTLAYAFDGGFIEATTTYNALGQVTQVSKPFHLATLADQPSVSYTTTAYDSFNRVHTVTDPLGVIDSSGAQKSTTIVTTYNGSTIETDRIVNGHTQTRLEQKNAIGKAAAVTTQTETGPSTISYAYDADGNLTLTTDPAGNQVQIGYDPRGRKVSTVDPDMGTWLYTQDGFGDLISQTDAKAQTVTMSYDSLGRMLTKTDATGTAQWVYDVAPGAGIGKLAAMVSAPDSKLGGACSIPFVTATGGNRAGKSFQYTAFGDMQEVDECADGAAFATSYQYDAIGRQSVVRYPAVNNSQLAVGYHYTSLGYLQYLTDESTDYSVLWQAKAMNNLGQVTDEQTRNGVETVSNRNPLTGWLLAATATSHADQDKVIQQWGYGFDEIGNLLGRTRTDAVNPVTSQEAFGYDLTNRLTSSIVTTSGGYSHSESYAYDLLGNITQKAGSAYTYGAGCQAGTRAAGPHAVCTVANGSPFAYDGDGNLTASGTRSVVYNPSNKVMHVESDPAVSQGNDTGAADFMYGADGNRVVQVVTSGGTTSRTVYVGLGATGKSLYERTTIGTTVQHVNFVYAGGVHGGNAFALRILDKNGAVTGNKYYSFDHLGSVTAMSDDQGHIATAQTAGPDATVLGYDAWGSRRNPDGTAANPASFNLPVGHREFTGQEQIPDVGLVNMNGRLYDPVLGRFLSPDPNVQFVADLQSYNRYSYAANNPLRYTDPTGFFLNKLGHFFKTTFSNPITDIELGLSLAVCVGSSGAECFTLGMVLAAENAGIAIASGASFNQTALNTAIGVGIGLGTFGLGQAGHLGGWQSFVVGEISSALSTMASNALSGQDALGWDVLGAVLLTAAESAVTMGLQKAIAVSQASAQEAQGGGGSGEARLAAAQATAAGEAAEASSSRTSYMMAGDFPRSDASAPMADLLDDLKGLADWGARCSAGPCTDVQYRVLDMAANHPTAGVQGEVSVVTPFTSRGGSVFGFNLQLNMDPLHDSGLFFYYTPSDAVSGGLSVGGEFGFNLAYGRGSWSGPFDNVSGSLGPVGASVFRSPGWTGSGPGYAGLSLGLSYGAPIGGAVYTTNYVPLIGD